MDMIALHHRRVRGEALTEAEAAALLSYLAQCDAQEAQCLAPAIAREEQEAMSHTLRMRHRETLLQREEALLKHFHQLLEEANAIRREWQQAA